MDFTIAPQTKIAFIGYLLIILAKLLLVFQSSFTIENKHILFLFGYLIVIAISLYAINCTILGSCHTYAWIVSYIILGFGLFSIVIYMTQLF